MSLIQIPALDNERIDKKVSMIETKSKSQNNTAARRRCFFVEWTFVFSDLKTIAEYESRSIIDTLGFIGGM